MRRVALLIALLGALLALCAPAGAQTTAPYAATTGIAGSTDPNGLQAPTTQDTPPAGHRLTAQQVTAIANRNAKIRRMLPKHPGAYSSAFLKGQQSWQVSFYRKAKPLKEIGQVTIYDATGGVQEAWTGYQVPWTMARGYDGAFGRAVNKPWIWIVSLALFLLPFVRMRMLLLDLAVLGGFAASLAFFNQGTIGASVPIAYPLLAYVLGRMLWIGLRRRALARPPRPLRLLVPPWVLAVGIVFVLGFRIGLDIQDSNVIDVGYAGVIGSTKVLDGQPLYGGWPKDNASGDTYGPVNYLAYVPFTRVLGWSGKWDDLPAAKAASIAFDLLCCALLFFVGRRLRGPTLGIVLAWLWATFPFTVYTQNTGSNDALVGLFALAAVALAARPALRGAAGVLGGLTKFVTLGLLPLLAFHRPEGEPLRPRRVVAFAAGGLVAAVLAFLPVYLNGQGLPTVFDRTIAYQLGRTAPFSVWGLYGWDAAQRVWEVAAIVLGVVIAFVPRRRDLVGLAACAAAVIIALQMSVQYWFYTYLAWFLPLVFLALLGRYALPGEEPAAPARSAATGTDEPASGPVEPALA